MIKQSYNLSEKDLKYLIEHIRAIFPDNFSNKYLFHQLLSILNKEKNLTIRSLRVKLIEKIIEENKEFFAKLKEDIKNILDSYNLLQSNKNNQEELVEILWEEIGLSQKEKERFLLYIKGVPFLMCREKIEERVDLIRRYVDSLSDFEKIIIGFYYYEGLTLKEISNSLGISHEEIVIKFSLIAFKFLFKVCNG